MPLYYYYCSECSLEKKRIVDVPVEQPCPKCNKNMARSPRPPTSQVMEVVDNGLMSKRVERLNDIESILKERSDKHSRETRPKDQTDDKTQEN